MIVNGAKNQHNWWISSIEIVKDCPSECRLQKKTKLPAVDRIWNVQRYSYI